MKTLPRLFIIIFGLVTTGCLVPNMYKNNLTDYGLNGSKTDEFPKVICDTHFTTLADATNKYEQAGFTILGYSQFEDEFAPVFDALQVAKDLGATHLVFVRQYSQTITYDETRTGVALGTATTTYSGSSQYNTYGTIGRIGRYAPYQAATYGQSSGMATTTTYTPYQYTTRVAVPFFVHTAIYASKRSEL